MEMTTQQQQQQQPQQQQQQQQQHDAATQLFYGANAPTYAHLYAPEAAAEDWAEYQLQPGSLAPLVGTLAKLVKVESLPNGELIVVVRALARLRVTKVLSSLPFVTAQCALYNHPEELLEARPLSQFAVGHVYHEIADQHFLRGGSEDIEFAMQHNMACEAANRAAAAAMTWEWQPYESPETDLDFTSEPGDIQVLVAGDCATGEGEVAELLQRVRTEAEDVAAQTYAKLMAAHLPGTSSSGGGENQASRGDGSPDGWRRQQQQQQQQQGQDGSPMGTPSSYPPPLYMGSRQAPSSAATQRLVLNSVKERGVSAAAISEESGVAKLVLSSDPYQSVDRLGGRPPSHDLAFLVDPEAPDEGAKEQARRALEEGGAHDNASAPLHAPSAGVSEEDLRVIERAVWEELDLMEEMECKIREACCPLPRVIRRLRPPDIPWKSHYWHESELDDFAPHEWPTLRRCLRLSYILPTFLPLKALSEQEGWQALLECGVYERLRILHVAIGTQRRILSTLVMIKSCS